MRRIALLTLLAVLAAGAPRAAAQEQPDSRPGIAVLPFTNGGSYGPDKEDIAPLEVGVQQMLLTELAQNPQLRIVERSRIREILEEQGLATNGQVDPRTAAQVGKLVGARYVITGAFMDLFGNFRLDGRIVDVETGEIIKTQQVNARRQNLYGLMVQLASKITEGVNLPPLPAQVAQARMQRQIPPEAVTLYSRAQVYEDSGHPERAIELYRQIAQRFPEMTEAKEALKQLGA
jgi:TolB-like protein